MPACPRCGQDNPDIARFCLACGAELAVEPTREERKVVSVLFCDLVGFTARAERLDPEEVRRLLQPYHTRLRAELERHGGTVEKFIGDAVMAVFGAPVAHEDDPERAVRAALAIRDAIAEEGQHEVRIGVTTGEALIALHARPAEGEGFASGDVVNTAARLQSAAPVNAVLVDETTFRPTERAIEYGPASTVQAKGKAEPVMVREAIRARVGVERLHGAPLVGRDREIALLRETLARVEREREPQLVTLVGVPGIGKSRLVFELYQELEQHTELRYWRHGRSLPYGEGVSFWALSEIVKAQAGILESDGPDLAGEKLHASVDALLSDDAEARWVERHLRPLAGLEQEQSVVGDRRSEAFAAWRRFLEALAEERPLVLVFEDLHWADEALLDFVDELAERTRGVPILVVGTARPELLDRRPGWGGGKLNAATTLLGGLSTEETARLVHSLLGSSVLDAPVQSELLERASGNPLYAEEFARMHAERPGERTLPESVQGMIAARLDGLPREEKELVQAASVMGRVFWLGWLGTERWTLDERLHALERKEFVRRERRTAVAGETEYVFRHALVRDVAYEQIPRAKRADKHLAAAAWIESLGRTEDHAELLAHHYTQVVEYGGAVEGDVADRACAAFRAAGDRASALGTFPQAAAFYERALEFRPDADVAFRRAHALFYSDAESAADALQAAAEDLLQVHDEERAAEAFTLLAELWWHRGDPERSLEHQRRAAELVEDAPASAAKARVLAEVSRFRTLATGRADEGLALAQEAYSMAEALGLTELAASALNNIGIAKDSLGDRSSIADLEKSIELALSVNSPEAARGYNNLGALLWDHGETARSAEQFREAVRVGERFGNAPVAAYAHSVVAVILWVEGDWDEALRLADAFIAEWEAGAPNYRESTIRLLRARIHVDRGGNGSVVGEIERAIARAREIGDPQVLIGDLAEAAGLYADLGHPAEARAAVLELLELDARVSFLPRRVGYGWEAIRVARQLGLEAEVRAVVEQAVPSPWRDGFTMVLDERYAAAAEAFAEHNEHMSAAWCRVRAAEQLVAEGRRAEADEQLRQALEFYRSVGAAPLIREAESLLAATA